MPSLPNAPNKYCMQVLCLWSPGWAEGLPGPQTWQSPGKGPWAPLAASSEALR